MPVLVKGKYHQTIRETQINGTSWSAAHWKSLSLNYARVPHYETIASWLKPLYLTSQYAYLSDLNRAFWRLFACSWTFAPLWLPHQTTAWPRASENVWLKFVFRLARLNMCRVRQLRIISKNQLFVTEGSKSPGLTTAATKNIRSCGLLRCA